MNLYLKRPLVVFDLEATGLNIIKDRIVEIGLVKVKANGEVISKNHRVNPGIPIPMETSLIHGIYDEDIKDSPTFKDIASSLIQFMDGCDLAGFNILKFDVPMLIEEFQRNEVEFEVSKRKLVDTQKIFNLMEKRTLAAAYRFYCDQDLVDAHSALADAKASFEVLDAQVERYQGMQVTDLKGQKIGEIINSVPDLHNISTSNMVDFAGRMIMNKDGIEIFNFGKHKGQKVQDVLQEEPQYYDWIMKAEFPQDTKRKLTEIKLRNSSLMGK